MGSSGSVPAAPSTGSGGADNGLQAKPSASSFARQAAASAATAAAGGKSVSFVAAPLRPDRPTQPPPPPPQQQQQQHNPNLVDAAEFEKEHKEAVSLVRMIRTVFDGKSFERFLDDLTSPQLVDYVINHSAHVQSDESKVRAIAQRFAKLPTTSEHQHLFGSPGFRDGMVSLAAVAEENDAVFWFASALLNVTASNANRRLFAYRPLRNALVHLGWEAKHPETVDVVCQLFSRFTEEGANDMLFGTPAVRDCFAKMAPYASLSVEAICSWCGALVNVAAGEANDEVFGHYDIRAAVVNIAQTVRKPEGVLGVCAVFAALALTTPGPRLLGTSTVHEVMVSLANYATLPDTVECWSRALLNIGGTDHDNRLLFGSVEIHDAIVRVSSYAYTPGSVEWLCRAICGLCIESLVERKFCTRVMRSAIAALAVGVQDGAGLRESDTAGAWVCNAIINLTSVEEHKRRFSHESIRDALVALHKNYSQRGTVVPPEGFTKAHTRATYHVTASAEKPFLFAQRPFRSMLDCVSKETQDPETVSYLLGVWAAITNDDDNRLLCGGTRLYEAMFRVAELLQSPEAAQRWWIIVANTCVAESNRAQYVTPESVAPSVKAIRACKSPQSIVKMGAALEVLLAYRSSAASQSNAASPGLRSSGASSSFSGARMLEIAKGNHHGAQEERAGLPWAASGDTFAIPDLRDALLSVAKFATTADAVSWWSRAVVAILLLNERSRVAFCVKELRDNGVIVLTRYATTAESVRWLCKLLNAVALQHSFRPFMAHKPLQAALQTMKSAALATPEAVQQLSYAISIVTKLIEDPNFDNE